MWSNMIEQKYNKQKSKRREIMNITQNNTDMYTEGSSQQTFKIPNNNLDVRFEIAYHNPNNKILQTNKTPKIIHNL